MSYKLKTPNIWIVMQYEVNNNHASIVATFFKEENARACAGRLVGKAGIYISIISYEIKDA